MMIFAVIKMDPYTSNYTLVKFKYKEDSGKILEESSKIKELGEITLYA